MDQESCHLLTDESVAESQAPKCTPLPWKQLVALCTVRLTDPICYAQIFPYINEFMTFLHVTNDPSKVGFYSGIVESLYAVAQLCTIYHWAKLSDNIGRRPVVLVGAIGVTLTTLLFGLSRSLTQVLVSRSLAGLLAGNVAVYHSIVGESTDATNQAAIFPIYAFIWPLGTTIAYATVHRH